MAKHDRAETPNGRGGRLSRRGFAVAAAAAVVLVLLGTVAYAAVKPASDEAARQLSRSGRVRIRNSRGGDALVGMRGMVPGAHVAGTVKIGNASKKQGARFYLGLSKLIETQGTGGGRLSYRLVLVVRRLSLKRRPRLVYSGPLRQMPLLKLGTFRPRETRTYTFTVRFPQGDAATDNSFQAATTSLRFTWYARAAR